MGKRHMGDKPEHIPGGLPIISPEINVPGGDVHHTDIISPNGDVKNPHDTFTPDGGEKKVRIWPDPKPGNKL